MIFGHLNKEDYYYKLPNRLLKIVHAVTAFSMLNRKLNALVSNVTMALLLILSFRT